MSMPAPPRLLDLAGQSLLRDQASAIAALERLPMELFPPLFTAAFTGRHSETLKAMVQAWPFACLPLGALMKEQQPHQETFQAALAGLDVLLAQEVRPRRWKLQVLDLRKNAHQDFWTVWSGTRASMYSLLDPEVPGPKPPLAPVEVLIDLCLKERTPDESLAYLIQIAQQRKGMMHLCCKKLKIFAMPMQNIKKILRIIQLDSIQDLEVNCTWKLSTLGKFAPHLGQMGNLRRLLLSHIHMSSHTTLAKEEQCISQFTAQPRSSPHPSVYHLQPPELTTLSLPRCLMTPLETLSITNCLLSESDLTHLSQHLNVSQLKDLGLSGVSLTNMSPEPLQVLIERASATLQDLDLDEMNKPL
uniref:PRAME nuclear receptor transcriptional regulator n=1 Tax=Canis lupus dingo TaxID=286419 RepID=A0A8C0JTL2_CANLU